jgi:hypothetical protein
MLIADLQMYFFRAGGHNWISLDQGQTVEYVNMGHQWTYLSVNPANSAVIIGFWRTDCCSETAPCSQCSQEVCSLKDLY